VSSHDNSSIFNRRRSKEQDQKEIARAIDRNITHSACELPLHAIQQEFHEIDEASFAGMSGAE
jgi:hypothetical protein